jgi:lipoprotein-anchoring transpeptidase ErfK/SrfK
MNRVTDGDDFLPRSIMCLGFIGAALIVAVQSMEFPTGSATAAPSQRSHPSAQLPNEEHSTPPSLPSSLAAVAYTGLTDSLEVALEPLLGVHRSTLFINLSERQVHLYYGETPIATYEIAIGRSGWETPIGEFEVINMEVDPIWQNPFTGDVVYPGAENPLGSRWIGFWANGEQQIGLHGTYQEELIGQAVSHGCIRMREADVQALYEQVTLGTVVVVRP